MTPADEFYSHLATALVCSAGLIALLLMVVL